MRADVPPERPAETCPYCGRPFPDAEILTLHKGRTHAERLSEEERTAVRGAREREADEVRMFQLQALGLLVLLYFGFLMTYAVVT